MCWALASGGCSWFMQQRFVSGGAYVYMYMLRANTCVYTCAYVHVELYKFVCIYAYDMQ